VCKCVLPPADNTIAVNKYIVSYYIIFLMKVKKPGQRKIFNFYMMCLEKTTELFKAVSRNDFRGCFEDSKAFMD